METNGYQKSEKSDGGDGEIVSSDPPHDSSDRKVHFVLIGQRLTVGLLLIAMALLLIRWSKKTHAPQFMISSIPLKVAPRRASLSKTNFVSHDLTPMVHSATATETKSGKLLVLWYGGEREGAKDVAIYQNEYDQKSQTWTKVSVAVTRDTLRRGNHRYIKKLGNPTIGTAPDGRLWLFFVSSFGGWSCSSINLSWSDDEGKTWQPAKKIIASPFANISSLVRTPPLFYKDGGVGLATYHEMIGKFGEFLHLDTLGNVVHKSRMSRGRDAIQPMVIPSSLTNAVNFMRYCGKDDPRVWKSETEDGGLSWNEPEPIELPNPNAAVAGLRLSDGGILLAFNNSADSRDDMSIARSDDNGTTWRVLHSFEKVKKGAGGARHEYSYPCLIQTRDGTIHLFYTWRRTKIKHVPFNQAWLEEKMRQHP